MIICLHTFQIDWSVKSLFDKQNPGNCPLASRSNVLVKLPSPEQVKWRLSLDPHETLNSVAVYHFNEGIFA
jgi:hypothetical protein